jgi:predicted MPP superfamily phosphohydrolase
MIIDRTTQEQAAASTQPRLHWRAGLALSGLAAGAGAATLGYALLVEPMTVRLERLTIRLPHAGHRLPAQGLRILHLSDTHFQGRAWRERTKIDRILRLVHDLEYDLLVHTGDFLHFDHGLANVCALLDLLPQPRLGSFGVLGNHDYRHYNMAEALPRMWRTFQQRDAARSAQANPLVCAWMTATRWPRYVRYVRNMPLDGRRTGVNDAVRLEAALLDHGMTLLHNRAVRLQRPLEGLDIFLAGVDDVTEGRPHLGDSLHTVPTGAPVVLLSHNPDILVSPQIDRVDVVLSGHTHGGQIRLPLWGPAHTQTEHLSRAEVSGYFRRGRTHVYITRGVGEGIPLRFGAAPQIALITVTG